MATLIYSIKKNISIANKFLALQEMKKKHMPHTSHSKRFEDLESASCVLIVGVERLSS